MFRHVVGVDDYCPPYAVPCESYRTDLAVSYQFDIVPVNGTLRVNLETIMAWPSQHTSNQTFLSRDRSNIAWVQNIFNELSGPAVTAKYDRNSGAFRLSVADHAGKGK